MSKYRVDLYVEYNDWVEIEAEDQFEAELLARKVTEVNLSDKTSVEVRSYGAEVISDG